MELDSQTVGVDDGLAVFRGVDTAADVGSGSRARSAVAFRAADLLGNFLCVCGGGERLSDYLRTDRGVPSPAAAEQREKVIAKRSMNAILEA